MPHLMLVKLSLYLSAKLLGFLKVPQPQGQLVAKQEKKKTFHIAQSCVYTSAQAFIDLYRLVYYL